MILNVLISLRIHHYTKNLLIFLPFFLSNEPISIFTIKKLFLGFLSFSLCASAVYILNDLFDLSNDKKHLTKKFRPLASKKISFRTGVLISLILTFISFFLAINFQNENFLIILIAYFFLSFFYSFMLKKLAYVDCFVLALFYVLRIFIGAEILSIYLSFWLIDFCFFFFLSLALLKRYNEVNKKRGGVAILGRGYFGSDSLFIKILGLNSALISLFILTLYLNTENALKLFNNYLLIWLSIFLIFFWIIWVWVKADRNQVGQDPIVFALTDRVSIIIFILLSSMLIFTKI